MQHSPRPRDRAIAFGDSELYRLRHYRRKPVSIDQDRHCCRKERRRACSEMGPGFRRDDVRERDGDGMDISDWIERWAAFAPRKTALRTEDAALSYAELAERIAAAASAARGRARNPPRRPGRLPRLQQRRVPGPAFRRRPPRRHGGPAQLAPGGTRASRHPRRCRCGSPLRRARALRPCRGPAR